MTVPRRRLEGEIAKSSEAERVARSAATGGGPITEYGERTPYLDYSHIDTLLDLQHPRSGTHDEMTFYIMGQVIELLFKLLHHELVHARKAIGEDDLPSAFKTFPRANRILELLVKAWEVLSTLTPNEFNAIRDYLGTASGFGSYMYRHLEFLLGNKVERMLEPHKNVPHIYPALRETFEAPSLYDEVIALLSRRGFAIDPAHLNRDWSESHQPSQSVEDAWLDIYRDPRPDNDLFQLGEHLTDLSQLFKHWRYHHVVMVERMIGFKPGTGGSAGVQWLRDIVSHEFFPELWAVRTRL